MPQNFVLNVVEAQLNGSLLDSNGQPTALGALLGRLDVVFTCLFTAELSVNLYGHWLRRFISDRSHASESHKTI